MHGKITTLFALAALYPMSVFACGIYGLLPKLDSVDCYSSTVDYHITQPQADEDVVYSIDLFSSTNDSDMLSPADYLIDWTLRHIDGGLSHGFSAYSNGSHYRYRDQRLQEYHMRHDSVPFLTQCLGKHTAPGVQQSAQFVQLLPQCIAQELRRQAADSCYTVSVATDTIISGEHRTVVTSTMHIAGYVCQETVYTFDKDTVKPISIYTESNPGSIGEQSITAYYSYNVTPRCQSFTEESLIELYPEAFERFRQSNFRAEHLAGTPLPGFSLPTSTGSRYTRQRSERFREPTVIALLNATDSFTPHVISALRTATDAMPMASATVYAFTDTNLDDIEAVCPTIRHGETTLINAGSLKRDCGAATLPVVIVCRHDGTVHDVIVGYKPNLAEIVIQSTTLTMK